MKTRLSLTFLLLASIGVAVADAPRKAPLTRYTRLWTDSPFTSKPVVEGVAPVANPLEDFALGGITKMADGYYAILFNKKKPEDPAVVIRPGSANGFEVIDVKRGTGGWKDTVVTVRSGRNTGTVTFEDALLAVKVNAPPPPPPQVQQGGQRGQRGQDGQREPRPRVVVPPQNQQQQNQPQQGQQGQQLQPQRGGQQQFQQQGQQRGQQPQRERRR